VIAGRFRASLRPVMARAIRAAAAVLLAATTACAAHSYMGIPLVPGQASPDVQSLARRAQSGDKQAQLDLGIRFEEGDGVPVDRKRAIMLYRQAASGGGGVTWVYSPPVGIGTSGRVLAVERGVQQKGLAEAKARLVALEKMQEED
jgi:TPR repeat protein